MSEQVGWLGSSSHCAPTPHLATLLPQLPRLLQYLNENPSAD